jgi:hypothetical protein
MPPNPKVSMLGNNPLHSSNLLVDAVVALIHSCGTSVKNTTQSLLSTVICVEESIPNKNSKKTSCATVAQKKSVTLVPTVTCLVKNTLLNNVIHTIVVLVAVLKSLLNHAQLTAHHVVKLLLTVLNVLNQSAHLMVHLWKPVPQETLAHNLLQSLNKSLVLLHHHALKSNGMTGLSGLNVTSKSVNVPVVVTETEQDLPTVQRMYHHHVLTPLTVLWDLIHPTHFSKSIPLLQTDTVISVTILEANLNVSELGNHSKLLILNALPAHQSLE